MVRVGWAPLRRKKKEEEEQRKKERKKEIEEQKRKKKKKEKEKEETQGVFELFVEPSSKIAAREGIAAHPDVC